MSYLNRAISATVTDLYASRPATSMQPSGFSAWDLAVGGLTPGIVRLLGPRSLELALNIIGALPNSDDDVLIVGLGRSPRVLSALARRADLDGPKLLKSADPAVIVHTIRSHGWRYVVLDRLDVLRMNPSFVEEIDEACVASETVFFACGTFNSAHASRIEKSSWSRSIQSVRLISERAGHANGVFELRVIDNPLAPNFVSTMPIKVEITANGRFGLRDVDEDFGPLMVEVREAAED
jgi:hypothetical protein